MSRVGIVVVSHSPGLARAAVELGLQMVPGEPPPIALAAGTADGQIGTDAVRVAEAITEADLGGDGVLVFMDLGSAVLSAEMALEFVPQAGRVRLTSAPFVEGLLAAIVAAAASQSLDRVEQEALGALGAKSAHLDAPPLPAAAPVEAVEAAARAVVEVVNQDGLHARPAALIVAALGGHEAELVAENLTSGGPLVQITGTTALLGMGARQGDRVRLHATGQDAAGLLAELTALFADGFGESREPAPARSVPTRPIGVSPGLAVGPVHRVGAAIEAPPASPLLEADQRAGAAEQITAAAAQVADELSRRAAKASPQTREILRASAQIVADAGLLDQARARVSSQGQPPAFAVWAVFGAQAEVLRAQGGRIGERAADLEDAKVRLVAALTGQTPPGLPEADEAHILLARDLAPADTALLDPRTCLALVTEEGGPTSHTAIIARGLGIPAVVGAKGAWTDPQGTVLLVNGSTGELTWDPSAELVEQSASARLVVPPFEGRGLTADGVHIPLLANIGSGGDAEAAAKAGAEGVGLFRTEFCFMGRAEAPTLDEQVEAYRPVLAAFGGKRVVVRTLDAGSDKPLAFVTDQTELNPALGVRGYRTAAKWPGLLEDQLRAIALAASSGSAGVAVMAPMIATVEEAAAFVAAARAHGLSQAGIMIETPAAAILADRLFEVVDFVSLGTNDLTQYTMAADRLVGDLAALNDPWQPAVLDLIGRVGAAGAAAGKPVGVCGEAAADPLLAATLVGLGVTSLSMTPRCLPAVAARLGGLTLAQCRSAAEAAVRATSPAGARAAVRGLLEPDAAVVGVGTTTG